MNASGQSGTKRFSPKFNGKLKDWFFYGRVWYRTSVETPSFPSARSEFAYTNFGIGVNSNDDFMADEKEFVVIAYENYIIQGYLYLIIEE